ncbi:hypothetical protein NX773_00625 [Massilia solisilvae]|uniref:Uncharacterized protein n=1 Tax=Massilia solisilvae TaxID=1811225 RepID=A0ABT2BDR7_9BURK|nr:hypothetical protein [Massilia solisilvae]MCS0606668.1 hypothetical protein [Massilia solisilvae]
MARTTRDLKVAASKCGLKQVVVALAAQTLFNPAFAAQGDAPWPQVRVPQQVETFDIGQEVVVNGTPVRMRGFVSSVSPAALTASFRQVLGEPLMEDRRGNTLVLGRGEGRYYMTVQLDPAGFGTRGVIAVTRPPIDQHEPADAAARRLLSALPPGSTLASHTSSIDGGTRAEHDAVINSHSIGVNSEYVQRMLRANGFSFEREAGPSKAIHARTHLAPDARTLFFKRPGAEATAVLFSDASGKSVIVMNRVVYGGAK